ncbi:MAG: hypothetical protein JXO44_00550 [Clostridia bacterium]|nr:hypothetical protein [Clostridia bacterium]
MDTKMMIISVLIALGGSAAIVLYYYRKRSAVKLYEEVFQQVQMVPKQKRTGFLLMMFRDSVSAQKNKNKTQSMAKYSNPKYVEAQLLMMQKALKDRKAVKDKTTKKALIIFDSYMNWEKKKLSSSK